MAAARYFDLMREMKALLVLVLFRPCSRCQRCFRFPHPAAFSFDLFWHTTIEERLEQTFLPSAPIVNTERIPTAAHIY
jgi:hypothetical protein